MDKGFNYKFPKPPARLDDFVESTAMFRNQSEERKEVVVMPDGRVDLFFSISASGANMAMLDALELSDWLTNGKFYFV